ncbi:SET and MYND domain-containing protein DDB_G0284059 [Eurytemora carolleeae]|uniref:SET and MYND domain-containing protein DDB_G0284059 n=1 Tax=Eurytemora carolleeae TaxID=1294199 RepID=UPI000C757431|nr:SET and MYND domain-containing protein DDB_G0284059 [Eurytemora carolleeae]|eukprot:XP_023339607.1 SET and MYND domain-containing protein DDB_G0284059-like [Eurytemora affinis]
MGEELSGAAGFLEVVYREICTEYAETIYSLQEKNVTDSEALLRQFSEFPEATFKQYLNTEAPVLRKNKNRSNQLRESGNKAYSQKNNASALKLYTDAIRFAPYHLIDDDTSAGYGEELALAFANRSVVLVQLKNYEAALSDIDLAFMAQYPQNLRYKLYERKGRCLQALKQDKLAEEAFNSCLSGIRESTLTEEKKQKLETEIKALIKNLSPSDDKKGKEPEKRKIPQLKRKNKNFPAFSDSVSIQYKESQGRFGVAVRDIPLGELVCLEEPPCFYLHEEMTGVNCSNCFRRHEAPLPSPICTQNVFCSLECQKTGMSGYHLVESKFMDVLFQNGLKKKEWFLALRAVTNKPLEFFTSLQHKLDHQPKYGLEKDDFVYNTEDFLTLYNLVSHTEQWDQKEHAYKAFFALFFVRCLQKSEYFGEKQSCDNKLGPEELMIGKLLIHLMEVATMNSHEIGQLECFGEETSWLLGTTKAVGCALEPTLVLLNHSCDPSLIRLNFGTSTFCFASRFIKKGEEITDSYTLTYDVTPKLERLSTLSKKYKFECNCLACKEEWNTYQLLPKSFNDLVDNQLKLTAQNAGSLGGRVQAIQQLGAKIHRVQQNKDYSGALQIYPDFLKALDGVISPPHQFYVIARRSYSTCLWVLYGNCLRIN